MAGALSGGRLGRAGPPSARGADCIAAADATTAQPRPIARAIRRLNGFINFVIIVFMECLADASSRGTCQEHAALTRRERSTADLNADLVGGVRRPRPDTAIL